MDKRLLKIEKDLRLLKAYALFVTVLCTVMVSAGFQSSHKQTFEEITAKRVLIVDSTGKGRVLLASDYKNDNSAGLFFFNQEGTESGAFFYNGKRDNDGKPVAYSLLTMDQFKSDQVV